MKLYATIKNTKGKKESMGGDTSLFVELSYKNEVVGKLGLYVIFTGQGTKDIGYRVVWQSDDTSVMGNVLKDKTDYSLVKETKPCEHFWPAQNKDCERCQKSVEDCKPRCQASISNYPDGDEFCNKKATHGDYCKAHAEEFGEDEPEAKCKTCGELGGKHSDDACEPSKQEYKAKKQKGESYDNPRIAHKTFEHGNDWHD